ncbi:hypothetical protein [Erwinia phage phiEaP8]|uniref:Uncharacterized protein n=2 Tax=Caudoviricetes TaxID=2731619 RepID=A0A3G1QTL8_9CAUD|nr:hypothetical protein HYP64_gp13 [Erwinia phage phiEaP8]AWN06202.1 hypothetical protein [Erwinia phage phiEaP8]
MSVFALEQQLNKSKQAIDLRNLALKLSENAEFKKVILDEFCVKECARYAQLSADPTLSAEDRANSLALAQAAGHLKRYLSVLVRMGDVAESDLVNLQEQIELARAEEGAE